MLTITLLGTAATMPLPDRALSAAFAACGGHGLLWDCGEGTQAAARRAGVNLMRADAICLTHYHGDHIFGLPGLLQTLGAQGRTRPLALLGPEGLPDIWAAVRALPDSQLDRFMICLSMGYPDAESQLAILKNVSDRDLIEKVQSVMTIEDIKQAKSYVKNMQVKDEILRYIICLCEKTREHEHVELGISPRGVGALAEMAKSFALCEGRTYVVPDDVLAIFPDVCAHRLILNTKARRENVTAYEILEEIAQQTEKPKLLRK